jgi:hypothetical protein
MSKTFFFTAFSFLGLSLQAQVFSTLGASNVGGFCYSMTQPGLEATAVWMDNNLIFRDIVTISYAHTAQIYLGDEDSRGSGLAFVIQQESMLAVGAGGAALGYGGSGGTAIFPSIAIEIDTDPQAADGTLSDHLAIHFQGDAESALAGPVNVPNLEDGKYHKFQVIWTYDPLNPAQSTLSAVLDDTYSISVQFDPRLIFNSASPLYFGFTAGNEAGQANDQRVSLVAEGQPGACSSLTFPVELSDFSAQALPGRRVQLDWRTASEVNNHFFEVLRSSDARAWELVGTVEGSGTSQAERSYQFMDESPLTGRNLYRLRQVDFDGSFTYSPTVEALSFAGQGLAIEAFPVPARTQLFVELREFAGSEAGSAQLLDASGRLLAQQELEAPDSRLRQGRFEVGGLPPGLYLLRVAQGGESRALPVEIR